MHHVGRFIFAIGLDSDGEVTLADGQGRLDRLLNRLRDGAGGEHGKHQADHHRQGGTNAQYPLPGHGDSFRLDHTGFELLFHVVHQRVQGL